MYNGSQIGVFMVLALLKLQIMNKKRYGVSIDDKRTAKETAQKAKERNFYNKYCLLLFYLNLHLKVTMIKVFNTGQKLSLHWKFKGFKTIY